MIIAKSLSTQEKAPSRDLLRDYEPSCGPSFQALIGTSQRSSKMSFMLILCRHAVRSTDAEAGCDPLGEELQAGDLRPDHGRG